jgi:hypothetical protein
LRPNDKEEPTWTTTDQRRGSSTGTRDVTYDLTAVLYHALQGAENCQTYMGDAQGKQEHRQFFQQAWTAQKQLAEQAKQLLHDCLMQETGGGSSAVRRRARWASRA